MLNRLAGRYRRLTRWIAVFALAGACVPAAGQERLQSIAQHLADWRSKFVNIRVRSVQRATNESGGELVEDWLWMDGGTCRHESKSRLHGKILYAAIHGSNGKQIFYASYEGTDGDTPLATNATISVADPSRRYNLVWYTPLMVLWEPSTRTWLDERLRKPNRSDWNPSVYFELRAADGAATRLISSNYSGEQRVTDDVIELDPEHGYLPREVTFGSSLGPSTSYRVTEFREVQPGFWFPWKGTLSDSTRGQHAWHIESVELNQDWPAVLFEPPIGPGTNVTDTIAGKSYVHGGAAGKQEFLQRIQRFHAENGIDDSTPAAARGTPLSARRSRLGLTSWWMIGLGSLGCTCISLSVWLRRR